MPALPAGKVVVFFVVPAGRKTGCPNPLRTELQRSLHPRTLILCFDVYVLSRTTPIAHTRRLSHQRKIVRYGVNLLVETMGASLAGQLTYAA